MRVRPDIRGVARARAEEGFPYAAEEQLQALRLEEAERAAIECLADPAQPVFEANLPMPTVAKLATLMSRHDRLGAGCPGGMGMLPEEMWLRIFDYARTATPYPNAVELGPPPGSNATTGYINAPTPAEPEEGDTPAPESRKYACSLALGQGASQTEVYESVGVDLLESALSGYAATILAYGPRGSGKHHTIEGGHSSFGASPYSDERAAEGLLQRAVRHAFLAASRRPAGLRIRLACFVLHRRQAYDLLAADAPSKAELRRQDPSGERVPCYVDPLSALTINSVDEGLALIEGARAAQRRLPVCAACANWTIETDTFWNLYFDVPVAAGGPAAGGPAAGGPAVGGAAGAVSAGAGGAGGAASVRPEAAAMAPSAAGAADPPPSPAHKWLGSLSLVNLAACDRRVHCPECMGQSVTVGGAAREPPSIGTGGGPVASSSSSLALIVGQLADGRTRYVAYRDSPTTELLHDALGGRARAAFIAHLIPGRASMDYEHNRASCIMANKVLQVRNRPQRTESEPLGLATASAEADAAAEAAGAGAEERELEELQKLLAAGPRSSKRSSAPRAQAVDVA